MDSRQLKRHTRLSVSGRMAAGGHANHPDDSQSCDNEESQNRRDTQRAQNMAAAHTRRPRGRSRQLHVPDKHRPDEESDRLPGGRRFVLRAFLSAPRQNEIPEEAEAIAERGGGKEENSSRKDR
jgi:hypothetical protein